MTPLDHLTAAFECLWEAKIHLLEAQRPTSCPELAALLHDVATLRDRMEAALIELQAQPGRAPALPSESPAG